MVVLLADNMGLRGVFSLWTLGNPYIIPYQLSEHLGVSVRTGKPLQTPNHSAIMEHHCNTNHRISTNQFEILSKCPNNLYDLRTIESLYITKLKPNLNSGLPIDLEIFTFNQ